MKSFVVLAALVGFGFASVAAAEVVSVNFVGNGAAMGADEVAGVVQAANWNSLTGSLGGSDELFIPLVNQAGENSAVTLKQWWSLEWGDGITATPDTPGDNRMMHAGLYDGRGWDGMGFRVLIDSAIAAAGYDLILYFNLPNISPIKTGFIISEATGENAGNKSVQSDGTAFSGAYIEGVNYYKYAGLTNDVLSLDIFSFGSEDGSWSRGISGFQIITIPEPTSMTLLGLGGLLLMGRRKP